MKWSRRLLIVTFAVLAAMATSVLWFLGIGALTGAYDLMPVTGNSMAPALAKGDLVLARSVRTASLQPGDVVVVKPGSGGEPAVIHRITAIDRTKGATLTTKGDANLSADPWTVEDSNARTLLASKDFSGSSLLLGMLTTARFLLVMLLGVLGGGVFFGATRLWHRNNRRPVWHL